jgi:hypothetical protein
MWHRFWPALVALPLGCAEPEIEGYEAKACSACDWVIPFGSSVGAARLVSDDEHLYWLQRSTQRLFRVPVAGGEVEEVADWLEASRGLLIDDGAVYTCEANPPETFAFRLVRFDKPNFTRAELSSGNVSSLPTLAENTLYYFERTTEENQLWQQPSQGGDRQAVLVASGASFPSSPVLLDDEIAWCANADDGITLFRYSKRAEVTTPVLMAGESACPDLVVMNGQLFGFSERDGGSLLRYAVDGPELVKSGITGDGSGRLWSTSGLAGKLSLLTQLGGNSIVIIDDQGRQVWRRAVEFSIQTQATSNSRSVFVGGERALARFALPNEAQP